MNNCLEANQIFLSSCSELSHFGLLCGSLFSPLELCYAWIESVTRSDRDGCEGKILAGRSIQDLASVHWPWAPHTLPLPHEAVPCEETVPWHFPEAFSSRLRWPHPSIALLLQDPVLCALVPNCILLVDVIRLISHTGSFVSFPVRLRKMLEKELQFIRLYPSSQSTLPGMEELQ